MVGQSLSGTKFTNLRPAINLSEIGLTEDHFSHNVAILRLSTQEFVMMGGVQGFTSNATCRHQIGQDARKKAALMANGLTPRQHCLELARNDSMAAMAGIRLTRGYGLPWSPASWTLPKVVITGSDPPGCIDRRPDYTGWPRQTACEFDGRLSLVQHRGGFQLFARANLRFGQVAGGRYVQMTRSPTLEPHSWSAWEPIRILGVTPSLLDIYFFAVSSNPVDEQSLIALFPVSAPPRACIALSFSSDGLHWSRPINLHDSPLSFRTADREGGGELEFRGGDHPAAGMVRSPMDSSLLFYIHHSVRGTTMTKRRVGYDSIKDVLKYHRAGMSLDDGLPHLSLYHIQPDELRNMTRHGLDELKQQFETNSHAHAQPLRAP